MQALKHVFFTLILLLSAGCINSDSKGSSANTIRVSLIPSKEAGSLMSAGEELKNWLENETGLKFEVQVPNSYVAVVEALGSKRADVAFLTTATFALAKKKYDVEPKFISVGIDGKSTYKGQIIVRVDSGIKSLSDLKGKKMAYVDPSSASGYILPAHLLKEKGIKPGELVFAGKHDSVVTMVYQRQADAGATFYSPDENGEKRDARRLVKTQLPDVFDKIKVLEFTSELPNDALVFRRDLDEEIKGKLEAALFKWSVTPDGRKSLKEHNNGSGLKKVAESDYTKALKMLDEMSEKQ